MTLFSALGCSSATAALVVVVTAVVKANVVLKKARRETSPASRCRRLSSKPGVLLLYKWVVRLCGFENNAVVLLLEKPNKCVVDGTHAWHSEVLMIKAHESKVTPDETANGGRQVVCIVAASY